MGNTESSSSQFPPHKNEELSSRRSQSKSYDKDDKDNSFNTALKVGTAVAAATVFVFGALKHMNSDDSDDENKATAQSFGSSSRGFDNGLSSVSRHRHRLNNRALSPSGSFKLMYSDDSDDENEKKATAQSFGSSSREFEHSFLSDTRYPCEFKNHCYHQGATDGVRILEGKRFSASREYSNQSSGLRIIKIMTYNLYMLANVALDKRMKAVGDLIQEHEPHIILFQEVTRKIYDIFHDTNWYQGYECSVSRQQATSRGPFCMLLSKLRVEKWETSDINITMEKELCEAHIDVGKGQKLTVATCHLKSTRRTNKHMQERASQERASQAKQVLYRLNSKTDVIVGGDMNWNEDADGDFPLLEGWDDAWTTLMPEENGWTYDTKSNPMLADNWWQSQKRFDRFLCKLQNFKLHSIERIGMDPIPGVSHRNNNGNLLHVLPSDHYGLLLSVSAKNY